MKLADVGTDNKRASYAAKRCDANVDIRSNPGAGRKQLIVHLPGHGIARDGPIEDYLRDAIRNCQMHLTIAHGANPTILDHRWNSTPAGWAQYAARDEAMTALLREAEERWKSV